ncbi:hypothetical protein BDZ89DRAFT_1128229 [Hymenopellis radicata]|nr:hypothetical protein BDZ89DRAFT_1128229 [Hymenopellis radicata]
MVHSNLDNFIPLDSSGAAQDVGRIKEDLRNSLTTAVKSIRKQAVRAVEASARQPDADGRSLRNDMFISTLMHRIPWLKGRLALVASFMESCMAFCNLGRAALELQARMTWLIDVRQRIREGLDASNDVLPVVGALTTDLAVCDNLYRAGVPVWLVRPTELATDLYVREWLDENLPIPSEGKTIGVSFDDETPPYPVIFEGSAHDASRYRAMYELTTAIMSAYGTVRLHKLVWSSSPIVPTTSSSTSVSNTASSSTSGAPPGPSPSPSLPNRVSKKVKNRPSPYQPSRPRPPPHAPRNKFIDVDSPLMPPSLPMWARASRHVGEQRQQFQPHKAIHGLFSGYAIPDPNSLVSAASPDTVAGQLRVWLKLRDVFLYRLRAPPPTATQETKSRERRKNMQDLLTKCLVESNMQGSVNLSNLSAAPTCWRDQNIRIDASNLSPRIIQPILLELCEIGFRQDLLAVDRQLYTLKPQPAESELRDRDGLGWDEFDAATWADREAAILMVSIAMRPAKSSSTSAPVAKRSGARNTNAKAVAARKRADAAAVQRVKAAAVHQRAVEMGREEDPDLAALNAGYEGPGHPSAELPSDDEDVERAHESEGEYDMPGAFSDDDDDQDDSSSTIAVSDASLVTPVKKRKRHVADEGDAPVIRNPYKVTGKDITPRSKRFAAKCKGKLRLVTGTENPYPGMMNRLPQVAEVMESVATAPDADAETKDVWARLSVSPEYKAKVMQWISYVRGNYMNELRMKARAQLGSLGLPGAFTPAERQELIAWLEKSEGWKFGAWIFMSSPFGAAFFEAMPRAMVFEGRGKADSEIFRHLLEIQTIPNVMMALFMTAVEHCLKEWKEGVFKALDFKEDCASRYFHHLAGLENLEAKAPNYASMIKISNFKQVLIASNKTFLLETPLSDTLRDLDFESLEKFAATRMSEPV